MRIFRAILCSMPLVASATAFAQAGVDDPSHGGSPIVTTPAPAGAGAGAGGTQGLNDAINYVDQTYATQIAAKQTEMSQAQIAYGQCANQYQQAVNNANAQSTQAKAQAGSSLLSGMLPSVGMRSMR